MVYGIISPEVDTKSLIIIIYLITCYTKNNKNTPNTNYLPKTLCIYFGNTPRLNTNAMPPPYGRAARR